MAFFFLYIYYFYFFFKLDGSVAALGRMQPLAALATYFYLFI